MKFIALLLLPVLFAVVPSFAHAEEPVTKLRCSNGKGDLYALSFTVERSKLGPLPEGCEVEATIEKKYEAPSFVHLQMTKEKQGQVDMLVGSFSEIPDAELVAEWNRKASSLCPAEFKMEKVPFVDESHSSEFCKTGICTDYRVVVGAIRCVANFDN